MILIIIIYYENEDQINVIIIGYKIDLNRQFNKEAALKFSKESGFKYYKTSVLTGEKLKIIILEFINNKIKGNIK